MEVRLFNATVEKFIASLEPVTSAKVLRTIDLLEKFGHLLGLPHSKKVSRHLFELRIRGVHEVRLLYAVSQGVAVLLYGFVKKSQQLPRKALQLAEERRRQLDKI